MQNITNLIIGTQTNFGTFLDIQESEDCKGKFLVALFSNLHCGISMIPLDAPRFGGGKVLDTLALA
jgi:hypothetical protein